MKDHTKHDFKVIRNRIEELKLMYRRLKSKQEDDGTWSWWIMAEIDELERELAIAQTKKIAAMGDKKENVIFANIASWQ